MLKTASGLREPRRKPMAKGDDGGRGLLKTVLVTLGVGAVMALLLQDSYGWIRNHFFSGFLPPLPFWPALGFCVIPKWLLSNK